MTAQGLPWNWILAGALAAGAVLAALAFLRPLCREVVVPSIMLWQSAQRQPRYRVLWRKLARLGSLLPAATAIAAMLLTLAKPVLRLPGTPPPPRQVVIADAAALKTAYDHAGKLDPLHTAVVLADAGGAIVRDFGAPATVCPMPSRPVRRPDWHAVAALARNLAGSEGEIRYFCTETPPQLPERAAFRRVPGAVAETPPPPLAVLLPRQAEWARRLPGIRAVTAEAEAEVSIENAVSPRELEQRLYASELYFADSGAQRAEVPPREAAAGKRSAFQLGALFALLALAAAAIDFVLWRKNRIV
ncbi:MAG: hypothetical protein IJJ28_05950 [Lentisphaeria bacterium]|nr:hypothetical protein [Lentisphaeria bacterium]